MRRFFKITPALLFPVALLLSCLSNAEYFRSHTDLYRPSRKEEIKALFSVLHIDDKYSWLCYELSSSELTYKHTDYDSLSTATVKIAYRLQEKFGMRHGGDTANFIVRDHVRSSAEHIVKGKLKIKIAAGSKLFMDISVFDTNSGRRALQTLYVAKENIFSAQNFEVEVPGKGLFVNPYFSTNTGLFLRHERRQDAEKLFVDFFKRSVAPAAPPYSLEGEETFKYAPDSTFMLNKKQDRFELVADRNGFYHCRIDTSQRDGITFFYFYRGFPEVDNYAKMIECARYIMTAEEFNSAMNASNKKEAADKFWLGFAGSPDRARTLIATWYGRIKEANIYFSSYTEGWKTDRGMIYTVFGPPKNIYKTSQSESWVYGDERSPHALTFLFTKLSNPFTENDFTLSRNISYKNSWFMAVDMWRQGRVYVGK